MRRMRIALWIALAGVSGAAWTRDPVSAGDLEASFRDPPAEARPWVYWFWMDGNLSREGMTADLEAMRSAGIGGMIIMEVDVGVPRGPVRFMSPPWRALFKHAVEEAERLGLEITLNAGPGWTGSGGPWVGVEESMQHLVAGSVELSGPARFEGALPRPTPRAPHFVHAPVPAPLRDDWETFYRDVAVLAFPTPDEGPSIEDVDEKALYYRLPYSSHPGVKPYLPEPSPSGDYPANAAIDPVAVVDLTERLAKDGTLRWDVPEGRWTVVRLGRTSTGANTRPAPEPGIGFECDKLDRRALESHFEAYVGALLEELPDRRSSATAGWTMLHIDSWEMGAQNWTPALREEFRARRGYDPLPYLPALAGRVVRSPEISERFLWDLRQTLQELVIENHAGHLKTLGRRHGFGLSIEPYDMNPCSDLSLGGVADVPMCEFWSRGYGFDSSFSCFEAASIAHTLGRRIVAAESFTAGSGEAWRLHPGTMKPQADWAFCTGINRIVFHRYAHQPWLDRWPGMTMGPYGVHYERTQTWWSMVGAWHEYLARCQLLLRRGLPVADICYLAAEGAPHVFRPPPSALEGAAPVRDRRGYSFDACAPETLRSRASVKDGRLTFPDGMSYRVLVLPNQETMTPELLGKVKELVESGLTVVGSPPKRSPSLSGFPGCDDVVSSLAVDLWGAPAVRQPEGRRVGKGRVVTVGAAAEEGDRAFDDLDLLRSSTWIWHDEGKPAAAAPVAKRRFRRSFDLEAGVQVDSARLVLTADNAFEVSVNGERAGGGDNFTVVYALDVGELLRSGTNAVTVLAENGGESPNPAGLIAALWMRLGDGRERVLRSDRGWTSALPGSDSWAPALELGPWGMGPWGEIGRRDLAAVCPPLYCEYDRVARVLESLGAPPDFESDGPIRYTHRRDEDVDIYFVANRDGSRVEADCAFRVPGGAPELWDPKTGEIRPLSRSRRDGRRTIVPLELEAYESCFVVFRPGGEGPERSRGRNFPRYERVSEITGPWTVEFDPARGGPAEALRLESLVDWSRRPEEGIRYYSGTARYRTTFPLPRVPAEGPASSVVLDLGRVEVMARVRLNGRELGVAWSAPHRLDATGALRPGENVLEIEVANLWPNRLIGDRAVPPERRVAWTTWNPYRADSPLLESGLLGPVTLQRRVTAP